MFESHQDTARCVLFGAIVCKRIARFVYRQWAIGPNVGSRLFFSIVRTVSYRKITLDR